MKTVRRPPYPKWNPGYFPCSSLTPPFRFPHAVHRCPSVDSGLHGSRTDPDTDPLHEVYLTDGNVNGRYQSPFNHLGFLDGPDLAVFHSDDMQSADCPTGVSMCATISESNGWRDWAGPIRPHWGNTLEKRRVATVYSRLRHMARQYFDAHNQIGLPIQDVENEDELVVFVEKLGSWVEFPCKGSCMRPWVSSSDMNTAYQIFRTVRPDGRNGGASYHIRPKIFLSQEGGRTSRVQTHEFGHYYHRVFVEKYGLGGGFDRHGTHQERSLDEGLSYWYASDHASTLWLGRPGSYPSFPPKYTELSATSVNVHILGDVITNSFWEVRQLSGTDVIGWRRAVLEIVDTINAANYGTDDPFGGGSIMRGFADLVYQEAISDGVFADVATRLAACQIFVTHELRPDDCGTIQPAGQSR